MRWLSALLLIATAVRADDLVLLPGEAVLDGPKASQRFLVESRREAGPFVADRTGEAEFVIGDPNVAAVSADGTITPKGDGTTTLKATVGDRSITATITVKHSVEDRP